MLYISPTLLDSFHYYENAGDEYSDKARLDLIDRLNGASSPPTEAMQKGIDFEKLLCDYMDGKWFFARRKIELLPILKKMSRRTRGAERQVYVKVRITPMVTVHGFIDFLNGNAVYDVKTTSAYEFPKYLRKNQHLAYLAALRPCGISEFQYLITDFKDFYAEAYYWKDSMLDELRGRVNGFLGYLEIDPEMSGAFYRKAERNSRKYAA